MHFCSQQAQHATRHTVAQWTDDPCNACLRDWVHYKTSLLSQTPAGSGRRQRPVRSNGRASAGHDESIWTSAAAHDAWNCCCAPAASPAPASAAFQSPSQDQPLFGWRSRSCGGVGGVGRFHRCKAAVAEHPAAAARSNNLKGLNSTKLRTW
jgi:hypothetical protein